LNYIHTSFLLSALIFKLSADCYKLFVMQS
jgi:hypothetical protein